jgi:hypothetical protein
MTEETPYDIESRIRVLAEDLAAASGRSVDESVAALRSAFSASAPLMPLFTVPWYVRLLPVRWQQRWIFRSINRRTEEKV